MNYKAITILSMLLGCVICSCNSKRDRVREDMLQLQSQAVVLPLDKMLHLYKGKDTVMAGFAESEMKAVLFYDSTECSSCSVNDIFFWDPLIYKARKYQGKLKYYFIFTPKKEDMEELRMALNVGHFEYPVFIDTAMVFTKENPHIPSNRLMHCFLLDEDNKVVLIGNPVTNDSIGKMFGWIIKEKLGD